MSDAPKLEDDIRKAVQEKPLASTELATRLKVSLDDIRSTVATLVDKGALKVTQDWKVSG